MDVRTRRLDIRIAVSLTAHITTHSLSLLQVDVYSLKFQRDDRDTVAIWESRRQGLHDTFPPDNELFTMSGVCHTSLLSPPCLAWVLLSAAATRITSVDEFHNIARGHADLFCEYCLPLFVDSVLQSLVRRWRDTSVWEPSISAIPPTAMDKLASMTGVQIEAVAKHADVLLRPFFRQDEEQLLHLFNPNARNWLACCLLGVDWEGKEAWRKPEWDEFLANNDIPWGAVYHEYIRPLSEMCRGLLTVWQSRERLMEGGYLDSTIKRYIRGARMVFGQDFLSEKTIFHRVRHLPPQALGKSQCLIIYNDTFVLYYRHAYVYLSTKHHESIRARMISIEDVRIAGLS